MSCTLSAYHRSRPAHAPFLTWLWLADADLNRTHQQAPLPSAAGMHLARGASARDRRGKVIKITFYSFDSLPVRSLQVYCVAWLTVTAHPR